MLFDGWIADIEVATKKYQCPVSFGDGIIDVLVPFEVICDRHPQVLDDRHMLKLIAVQGVGLDDGTPLPRDAYYLALHGVELHHPSLLPIP